MPCVETKIVINGDSKPIFEIIKNMEAYPSFMHDLVSVEILERGENTTVSHWVSNVDGRFGCNKLLLLFLTFPFINSFRFCCHK